MKLYNMNISNFATKCRIAIYDKGAKVDIVAIPGNDSKSAEYLKLNPLGKIPTLDLHPGLYRAIATSNRNRAPTFISCAMPCGQDQGRNRRRRSPL